MYQDQQSRSDKSSTGNRESSSNISSNPYQGSSTSYQSSANKSGDMESSTREGPVARAIEQQTAKLPSDLFLWSAVAAGATSAVLKVTGRDHASQFIGQWVPPILLLGVYNKIVKVMGSDRYSQKNKGQGYQSSAV
jgi:hypothetical protein